MSMTAPGCGMGNVLKADVQSKLSRLPGVTEVHVEVVFDPTWHPGLMSDAAKLQLGFDLDYGTTHASPPIYGERKGSSTIGREDPGIRRKARNIRPHGHEARGVAVRARLSCWAFWSR